MPTARELLEQADALMQRNRLKSAPSLNDGIPTLMDVVPAPRAAASAAPAPVPAAALPVQEPARSAAAELDDVPLLTDVVEEIEAPSILEPPDLDDPDAWSDTLTGAHTIIPDDPIILPPPVTMRGASLPAPAPGSASKDAFASPDIPAAEWDAAVAPYVTTESIEIGVPAPGQERATFDEDATWTPGWVPVAMPEQSSPETISPSAEPAAARSEWHGPAQGPEPAGAPGHDVHASGEIAAEAFREPVEDARADASSAPLPPAEVGFGDMASPPAEPPAVDTASFAESPALDATSFAEPPALATASPVAEPPDFPAEPLHLAPELSDGEIASAALNPAPFEADHDLAALAREAPLPTPVAPPQDDARWAALAEEIRMQVLQRIDIFTDTGLREQLAQRLQPAVDRASADLVATINQHVGLLLRAYVAEAIEREIENWRRDSQ